MMERTKGENWGEGFCDQLAEKKVKKTATVSDSPELTGYYKGVQAVSAIKWACPYCRYEQFSDDTLSNADTDCVRHDRIICENCGEDNAVYLQEL